MFIMIIMIFIKVNNPANILDDTIEIVDDPVNIVDDAAHQRLGSLCVLLTHPRAGNSCIYAV